MVRHRHKAPSTFTGFQEESRIIFSILPYLNAPGKKIEIFLKNASKKVEI